MTTSSVHSTGPRARWIDRLPLFVVTAWMGAALMLVPAVFAGVTGDDDTARPFLYGAILFSVLILFVGLSVVTMGRGNPARGMLLSLAATYLLLPAMLALPVHEAMPGLSFHNAYFEMVSSLTSTGATVFDLPRDVPPAIHLWRATVGWYGGFIIWVAAIAILAPLRLGGFEVVLVAIRSDKGRAPGIAAFTQHPMRRVLRFTRDLAPVYGGLTLAAWLSLLAVGETPFISACHAMSALSSSGITPLASLSDGEAGRWDEVVLFFFMIFALARITFARDIPVPLTRRWWQDPELRLAAVLLAVTPAVIFLHHWIAVIDVQVPMGSTDSAQGLWGAIFMAMSFLTTTGFISADWDLARTWSGMTTPGLILLGLAMIGGGVATTAGGVKLLRVYVLYKHGRFETARLLHPHLVASPGHRSRRFGSNSAYIAWLYFMIFALSLTAIMLALSLAGVDFETSMILAVAGLTTTGQLASVGGDQPIALGLLDPLAQMILCVSMVLGRLETLAFIALLNPAFWRG